MMTNLWSIALTHKGIGFCVLNQAMERWDDVEHWPSVSSDHCRILNLETILKAVVEGLDRVAQKNDLPLAIGICAPEAETAYFADSQGIPVSPVYWGCPPLMSAHDIPEFFRQDSELAGVYRSSLLRNIQQERPEFGLNQSLGIGTLGSLVAWFLTGEMADCCLPTGVPAQFPDLPSDSLCWEALGLEPSLCYRRISPCTPCGVIQTDLLRQFQGIPVYMMGSCDSALAYATAADPMSWCVRFGSRVTAAWIADFMNFEQQFEISVHENDLPQEKEDTQQEDVSSLSKNDWTRILKDCLDFDVHPGPKAGLAGYVLKTADWNTQLLNPDEISEFPASSGGLHAIAMRRMTHLIGLNVGHDLPMVRRAIFEGLVYQLRIWLDAVPSENKGPVRLVLEPPWPDSCAQKVADILLTPVFWLNEDSTALSALGTALSLFRQCVGQDLPGLSLHADIIEPQTAFYEPHYRVHCALRQTLNF